MITLLCNFKLELKECTVMYSVLLLPFMNPASCSPQTCLLQRKLLPLFLNIWYTSFLCLRKHTGIMVSRKAESLSVVSSALCFIPYKYPSFSNLTGNKQSAGWWRNVMNLSPTPSFSTYRDDSHLTQLKSSWDFSWTLLFSVLLHWK